MSSSSNAVVNLSWSASTDSEGTVSYQLERSLDQLAWSVLSSDITGTTYTDNSADFGAVYYYEVQAIDDLGNSSSFAFANATTPTFAGTSSGGGGSSTYNSSDGLAQVVVPSGALTESVDCSVNSDSNPNLGTAYHVMVGPYSLVCKDQSGNQVDSFAQALSWTMSLKTKIKGFVDPLPYTISDNNQLAAVKNGKYSPSNEELTFTTASADSVLVLASTATSVPWDLLLSLLMVAAAVVLVAVLLLRKKQRSNYDDYLRSKYYNL